MVWRLSRSLLCLIMGILICSTRGKLLRSSACAIQSFRQGRKWYVLSSGRLVVPYPQTGRYEDSSVMRIQ